MICLLDVLDEFEVSKVVRFQIDHYLLGEFVKIIKFVFVEENIINQLKEFRIINLLIPLLL